MPAPAQRTRRTQAERTASTRQRLLDATVACLDEHGYAATTTTMIAERAGVSRGAQLHHFPTRADLVVATMEHVFQRSLAEFRHAIRAFSGSDDRIAAAIDLLWQAISAEKTRHTWIELVVGTRNDPALCDAIRQITRRLADQMIETFKQDVAGDLPLPEIAVFVTTALMDGLLLQRLAGQDEARTRQILETYKTLARLATAALNLLPDQQTPAPDGAPGRRRDAR